MGNTTGVASRSCRNERKREQISKKSTKLLSHCLLRNRRVSTSLLGIVHRSDGNLNGHWPCLFTALRALSSGIGLLIAHWNNSSLVGLMNGSSFRGKSYSIVRLRS